MGKTFHSFPNPFSAGVIPFQLQRIALTALWALALGFTVAAAQFSYPGCTDLKAADFKMTEILNRHGDNGAAAGDGSLTEPVQFDLHGVKSAGNLDHVDIYMVERGGGVKYYNGATQKISSMGSIATPGKDDNGLMGIALHPDFDNNRWLFLWYIPNQKRGQNYLGRLSRFNVKSDNTLDMASEKTVIEIILSKSTQYHSGGPMTFDAYGDLWVTVGNNSPDLDPAACDSGKNVLSQTDSTVSGEWGPSNTHSLRGGTFRIHPDSSARGYGIPAGNFGDYWAKQWDSQGRTALAAQYRDTSKVLPELYVKGDRSNYSIYVHPTKRWMAWGVVNYSNSNDEFNLITHPVFAGWPYFHQNNVPACKNGKNPDAPTNNSPFNSGVTDLPPATPSVIANLVNVAISGPIYGYDPTLVSRTKFPPHLNNTWVTMSWQSNQMHFTTIDSAAVTIKKTTRVDNGLFGAWKWRAPLQAKFGPEGALYVLNYDGYYSTIDPGIARVDYLGDCLPTAIHPNVKSGPKIAFDISASETLLRVDESGSHVLELFDLFGTRVYRVNGVSGTVYRLDQLRKALSLKPGLLTVRVVTSRGIYTESVALF